MVLRTGADHRRPADVDILDYGGGIGAGRDRLLEGIEVDDQKIDPGYAVGLHRRGMGGVCANAQKAAMDGRMQRLHPPIHDFRKPGELGDILDGQAQGAQGTRRPACRQQFHALPGQEARQFLDARLVEHGQQGAPDRKSVRGRIGVCCNGHHDLRLGARPVR